MTKCSAATAAINLNNRRDLTMSKFCKKCGAALEQGMAFCESCGTPVQAMASNKPASISVDIAKAPAVSGSKLWLGIGGGVAALVLLGVGIWFVTGAPGKPSATSLAALLNADDGFKSRTICLGNFQYDRNAANIDTNDQASQKWFGVLASAGLYNAPQLVTTGGWFSRTLLQYTPTEKGKSAIKNGKLCFAQGVELDKVAYGEVQQVDDKSYAVADYTYHFMNADEWTKRPEIRSLAPDVFGSESMTGKLVVERSDKAWGISTIPADSLPIVVAARKASSLRGDAASSDFLVSLTNLFSALRGNPLIGKWRNSISGDTLEFTATEVIGVGGRSRVNYEVKENQIKLTNPETQGVSLCTVTDKEHMTMVQSGLVYQFNRVVN